LGILGEVNLAELEDSMDLNEFYSALSVPPPKPGAIWIVYEYAGLTTLQVYCQPAELRRSKLPPKRGLFGGSMVPPPLPPWKERAKYVRAIMKQTLEAVATLHEAGLSHRSLGRSSVILSSKSQDKMEASNVYTTSPAQLLIKLADFGFSSELEKYDDDMVRRARTFGLSIQTKENGILFGIAEDLHALGFVFVGLLLTSLAELPSFDYKMPDTGEDSIQRLLGDIFDKNLEQFRDYVDAEDIWSNLVQWLDETDGWKMLESLWLARERAASGKNAQTAHNILTSSRFFQ
jgi:serine/threonine protein kinase